MPTASIAAIVASLAAWTRRNTDSLQTIRNWVLQAVFAAIAVSAFLLLITVIYRGYFNIPPVLVTRLNNADLGDICPGDYYPIEDRIQVERPIVLLLYISVLDQNATHSYNDTQTSFPGRPHPKPSVFVQSLPWTVPDLLPGKYTRVLAIRGTNGAEDPIFIESTFEVPEGCPYIPKDKGD